LFKQGGVIRIGKLLPKGGWERSAIPLMLMGTQWYLLFNVPANVTKVRVNARKNAISLSEWICPDALI